MPQHLVIRGNNRCDLFLTDFDRTVFLRHLREAALGQGCDVHAFVLMTNHVHLLATGREPGGISRMMQAVGRRYARYVNRIHGRTGTLFEGRFKASLVDGERYLLTCMRYIELNPVRAGMVEEPAAYVWSSFRHNAGMERQPWLVPRPEYLGLGSDPVGRACAYRALFRKDVAPDDLTAIRESARKSRALGGDEFLRRAEAILDRSIRVIPPGRPPKVPEKSNLTPFFAEGAGKVI